MKKTDLLLLGILLLLFLPFFLSGELYQVYLKVNREHGMWMSFLKFAILATLGETIGLRIKTGQYLNPGFGLLPKAIIWGLLGFTIKLAFVVFAAGSPAFLAFLGWQDSGQGDLTFRILTAFSISSIMNLIFAPLMMTLHKLTDMHIASHAGDWRCLFRPIRMGKLLQELDWNVQWNFVFKKTIVFFWIPAHTITFLLPPDFQVLFAAILGIVLGVLLAVAGKKKPT